MSVTTTENIEGEKSKKGRPKAQEEKPQNGMCPNCGKSLEAFVVAGGLRFCSDACASEYLARQK